jgi:hypothetical protein
LILILALILFLFLRRLTLDLCCHHTAYPNQQHNREKRPQKARAQQLKGIH